MFHPLWKERDILFPPMFGLSLYKHHRHFQVQSAMTFIATSSIPYLDILKSINFIFSYILLQETCTQSSSFLLILLDLARSNVELYITTINRDATLWSPTLASGCKISARSITTHGIFGIPFFLIFLNAVGTSRVVLGPAF